ncbi:hypothetical protein LEP1GSC151_2710 [Leptospira interrogans serovar Grippotyphosa str. LT2186]|uniref:Uncharacterized protein n=1 Tax=Leptospira interrogans serovar Grippotyphosa str. LT2186 TaxID=1001599 RepID=M3HBV6_LEPIR|nr:hypothetical protein LEP1GSC151_2710 [Leptospira interrogans serovar Grippotyphosa str. LT2186]
MICSSSHILGIEIKTFLENELWIPYAELTLNEKYSQEIIK